jgi:hypothetical protein
MAGKRTNPDINTYEMQRALVWYENPQEFLSRNYKGLVQFSDYMCSKFNADRHQENIFSEFCERVLVGKVKYDPSKGVPLFRYLFTTFRILLLHCLGKEGTIKRDENLHQDYLEQLSRFNDDIEETECNIDLSWLEKRLKLKNDNRYIVALRKRDEGYNLIEISRELNLRSLGSQKFLNGVRNTFMKMTKALATDSQYNTWCSFTRMIGEEQYETVA